MGIIIESEPEPVLEVQSRGVPVIGALATNILASLVVEEVRR
jgi:hypothetical protein